VSSKLRAEFGAAAPTLWAAVDALSQVWVAPVLHRLDHGILPRLPKTVNDAVWGTIELFPYETLLLDSPLLQRLRGIRQLGMAHRVYPGAVHDRLEHSLGVLEAAQQILTSLERNATNRQKYSGSPDLSLRPPSDRDRAATRLAALLHDIGHGPFSHATEHLIPAQYAEEFEAANAVLRTAFNDTTSIKPAEQMAALIVLSAPLSRVFEHARFGAALGDRSELSDAIAARILGSRKHLDATYLSGVVSGPLDADMIDYMARDGHHAGLPLGLDITRLVSKLEVVEVTTANALNPELQQRAMRHGGRFYDLGISRAGLGAFEQMVMARVTLYERLYYHHKVRAAEGLVRNLVESLRQRAQPVTLEELYSGFGDDAMIDIWGGLLRAEGILSGGPESSALAKSIKERDFHRAYAFSSRFITSIEGQGEKELAETQAILWSRVTAQVEDFDAAREIARAIFEKTRDICAAVSDFGDQAGRLLEGQLVVDLPQHSRVSKSTEILVASEGGHVFTPNLFFNAEKWANAYVTQKQCGYVFAPRDAIPLVALASRIVFYERFGIVMGSGADVAAKTHGVTSAKVYDQLLSANLCSAECHAVLKERKPSLLSLTPKDLDLPAELMSSDPGFAKRLAEQFADALPGGLPATIFKDVTSALSGMIRAILAIDQEGAFSKPGRLNEKTDLQSKLRMCLSVAGVNVTEGEEQGGGKADLILNRSVVLENKVLGSTADPFEDAGAAASWQVRRYSLAIAGRVRFVCAAYEPPTEDDLRPLTQRVLIRAAVGRTDDAAEVLFVIPYGHGVPSRAAGRAPPNPN
jgi:HD superfamily phosphohydrolase